MLAMLSALQLPDLLTLVRRGNVVLPVDPTHLGCLWVLDRCGSSWQKPEARPCSRLQGRGQRTSSSLPRPRRCRPRRGCRSPRAATRPTPPPCTQCTPAIPATGVTPGEWA